MHLQVVKHIDLPMWSVYTVQYAVFGTGLFGITYGILSARQVQNNSISFTTNYNQV